MEKYEKVSIIVIVLLAILLWGLSYGVYPLSDIASNIPFFIITAMFGVFLWGWLKRIENALGKKTTTSAQESTPKYTPDSNFDHLAIHYLRVKGAPDTPDSSQLRYITNVQNRQAIRLRELPEWLAPAIKEHKIMWFPYDDEKVLGKTLSETFFSIRDVVPLAETLGLKLVKGQWERFTTNSELLSKLGDRKLENLQVLDLTRRYFFSEKKRTLLIKFSQTEAKSEVWLAPPYIFELAEKGIIAEEGKGMRFYESCKKWCDRNGYTFIDRRYPESAFLAEGS
jgi:hypothetical protein